MLELRHPIPEKSARAWEVQRTAAQQNPGLLFDRYAPDIEATLKLANDKNAEIRRKDPYAKVQKPSEGEVKRQWLDEVRQAAHKADARLLEACLIRWGEAARAVHAEVKGLETDWRLVAGLGRKGPLEIGFTFNRYGFPYLPGSSVKGLARARGLRQVAQAANTDDLKKLEDALSADNDKDFGDKWQSNYSTEPAIARQLAETFRRAFGTLSAAGGAIFLDAWPDSARLPALELDVMTPHYPHYYQGNAFPTDDQNPIPVPFLTVAANTKFWFAVGRRNQVSSDDQKQALDWLIEGLVELGAGGKTSSGYGYFKPVQPTTAKQPAYVSVAGYWQAQAPRLEQVQAAWSSPAPTQSTSSRLASAPATPAQAALARELEALSRALVVSALPQPGELVRGKVVEINKSRKETWFEIETEGDWADKSVLAIVRWPELEVWPHDEGKRLGLKVKQLLKDQESECELECELP